MKYPLRFPMGLWTVIHPSTHPKSPVKTLGFRHTFWAVGKVRCIVIVIQKVIVVIFILSIIIHTLLSTTIPSISSSYEILAMPSWHLFKQSLPVLVQYILPTSPYFLFLLLHKPLGSKTLLVQLKRNSPRYQCGKHEQGSCGWSFHPFC